MDKAIAGDRLIPGVTIADMKPIRDMAPDQAQDDAIEEEVERRLRQRRADRRQRTA
ncbi:hypothetical protein [Bosea sp. Root381]|uniref:hypothetical protein n=1 Tax=Bosea sp. Root381 TaxID=1736524 RepID=UPI0012E392D9|nr:hypothetical protein [Bosea sp. Root381]